jgi:hypothetical protein
MPEAGKNRCPAGRTAADALELDVRDVVVVLMVT